MEKQETIPQQQGENTETTADNPTRKTAKKEGKTINNLGAGVLAKYNRLKGERADNVFFAELLEVYDKAADLKQAASEADKLTDILNERQNKVDELRTQNETLQNRLDQQAKEFADYKAGNAKGLFVVLDPLNKEVLNFVADRDKSTPSEVVNKWVRRFFVEGSMNGGFKTVPDKVVKELKGGLQ